MCGGPVRGGAESVGGCGGSGATGAGGVRGFDGTDQGVERDRRRAGQDGHRAGTAGADSGSGSAHRRFHLPAVVADTRGVVTRVVVTDGRVCWSTRRTVTTRIGERATW